MYYSYIEIEFVAMGFSPARMGLAGKLLMDYTTGTDTHWPHLDARPLLSMKIATHKGLGNHKGLIDGTSDHPKTITDVNCIMLLRHKLTMYQGQLNCSHSTANYPT
jgi:hypothetical protein